MANLEVQIGADNSEFQKKIAEVEKDIRELSQIKLDQIKLGLDTKEIDANIKDAKKSLSDLKTAMKDTGSAFQGAAPKIANGGNALMQFNRIAQDAPFGIMGIGNNITATAEAFSHLSKESGGAGGALKAVGASLAGPGGVLLAVSLVTTALTVMSQKGITVGDVFNRLTGNFDEFRSSLIETNKEAAKDAAAQVASVQSYVSAAKDINLSMSDRLIAVKKLREEYPGFFKDLTNEQILNGNVANAVRDVIEAIKARARAQAYQGKLGDLAAREVELRDKEAALIEKHNKTLQKKRDLEKQIANEQFNESHVKAWQQADRALKTYTDDLNDVQNGIRANQSEMDKWAKKSNIEVKASIKLDFKDEKAKKIKPTFDTPQVEPIDVTIPIKGHTVLKVDLMNDKVNHKNGIFSSLAEDLEADRAKFLQRLGASYTKISMAILEFNKGMRELVKTGINDVFGGIGDAIGQALANGTSVLESVGASIVATMGSILSSIGEKLIALGTASLLASTVFSTFGTALGVGAALAAIAGGIALKAGGSLLSNRAKSMNGGSSSGGKNSVFAGNSVSTPTSSVSNGGSFSGGYQNVVFEISGQSLVGVLSNTLNRNVKLGGVPSF